MSFSQAIGATAGIGIGVFIGCLLVLVLRKRAGADIKLLKDSAFFTALVAGMGAWTLAALIRVVVG